MSPASSLFIKSAGIDMHFLAVFLVCSVEALLFKLENVENPMTTQRVKPQFAVLSFSSPFRGAFACFIEVFNKICVVVLFVLQRLHSS